MIYYDSFINFKLTWKHFIFETSVIPKGHFSTNPSHEQKTNPYLWAHAVRWWTELWLKQDETQIHALTVKTLTQVVNYSVNSLSAHYTGTETPDSEISHLRLGKTHRKPSELGIPTQDLGTVPSNPELRVNETGRPQGRQQTQQQQQQQGFPFSLSTNQRAEINTTQVNTVSVRTCSELNTNMKVLVGLVFFHTL